MSHVWPAETVFERMDLGLDGQECEFCCRGLQTCTQRRRRVFTLDGPRLLVVRLGRCAVADCPGRKGMVSSREELAIAPPWLAVAWDVFAWIGHRRFARHWSVPQITAELADRYKIELSEDAVEDYVRRYEVMIAARHTDVEQMREVYAQAKSLVLAINGLQPEKGHETLYVVRELTRMRVWFAEPLLSSTHEEVRRVLARARQIAEALGLPVAGWMSDKQETFVQGIAEEFPGVPHRYCDNHFLRDLAKPVLEEDSHAKVQMRRKVRGLRTIEQAVLREAAEIPHSAEQRPGPPAIPVEAAPAATAWTEAPTTEEERAEASSVVDQSTPEPSPVGQVVLDYCAAVRGILNDDQGGPLHPPGLRMADALRDVRGSLQRNLQRKKGGPRRSTCGG